MALYCCCWIYNGSSPRELLVQLTKYVARRLVRIIRIYLVVNEILRPNVSWVFYKSSFTHFDQWLSYQWLSLFSKSLKSDFRRKARKVINYARSRKARKSDKICKKARKVINHAKCIFLFKLVNLLDKLEKWSIRQDPSSSS